jgi:hypothetical protein
MDDSDLVEMYRDPDAPYYHVMIEYTDQEEPWTEVAYYPDYMLDSAVERCISEAAEHATRGRVWESGNDKPVYEVFCNNEGFILEEGGQYIEQEFDDEAFEEAWKNSGF